MSAVLNWFFIRNNRCRCCGQQIRKTPDAALTEADFDTLVLEAKYAIARRCTRREWSVQRTMRGTLSVQWVGLERFTVVFRQDSTGVGIKMRPTRTWENPVTVCVKTSSEAVDAVVRYFGRRLSQ